LETQNAELEKLRAELGDLPGLKEKLAGVRSYLNA
jgi:hypothetical protein